MASINIRFAICPILSPPVQNIKAISPISSDKQKALFVLYPSTATIRAYSKQGTRPSANAVRMDKASNTAKPFFKNTGALSTSVGMRSWVFKIFFLNVLGVIVDPPNWIFAQRDHDHAGEQDQHSIDQKESTQHLCHRARRHTHVSMYQNTHDCADESAPIPQPVLDG